MEKLPRIVILGRPNVGKSTLFNRIVGRRRALVGDEPGMTRDRIHAPAEWQGRKFEAVDTGGLLPGDKDLIASEIFRQAETAVREASHLILVVDGRQGATPLDEELAQRLRRTGKPITLAVNKADTAAHQALAADFARLGIASLVAVSAEHGLGVDELLDRATASLSALPIERGQPDEPISDDATPPAINVAIIGHPNVGKSTLLNRLLNEDRSIVNSVAGTTRDAVDAEAERSGLRVRFIDTAGIRRKGKTKLLAEKLSVIQARKHLERSDVALVVLDAIEGVTALDTHIAGYAHESHRSVVLVVNKWDVIAKGPKAMQEFTAEIRRRMKYLDYAPIVFLSALRGTRLGRLWDTIGEVAEARRLRIPTAQMNAFLQRLDLARVPAPAARPLKIYYLTQVGVAPPSFVAFTNRAGRLHFSTERFLVNRIREKFGFAGSPILVKSRASQ
jgi:GTPase